MADRGASRSGGSQPWKVIDSTYGVADHWLRLRIDNCQLPDGRIVTPCPILEYPDWVDVIAVTTDGNVVLVDQYRHGVRRTQTEFPAGVVDGEVEKPLAAAQRELLEETGYASDEWHLIGGAPVNPAWQSNRYHSYLALGARRIAGQTLDPGEVIRPRELPMAWFIQQVEVGKIVLPALQLASLHLLQAYLRRSTDPRLISLRF